MSSNVEVFPSRFANAPCEAFMCHERSFVVVGQKDGPLSTHYRLCEKHYKDLIKSIHSQHPNAPSESDGEIDKLAHFLLENYADDIKEGSAVDTAIALLVASKEQKSETVTPDSNSSKQEEIATENDIPKQDEVTLSSGTQQEPTNVTTQATETTNDAQEGTKPIDPAVFPEHLEVPRPEDVDGLAWQDMRKWAQTLEVENYQSLTKEQLVPLLKQELQNVYDEALKGNDGE